MCMHCQGQLELPALKKSCYLYCYFGNYKFKIINEFWVVINLSHLTKLAGVMHALPG